MINDKDWHEVIFKPLNMGGYVLIVWLWEPWEVGVDELHFQVGR